MRGQRDAARSGKGQPGVQVGTHLQVGVLGDEDATREDGKDGHAHHHPVEDEGPHGAAALVPARVGRCGIPTRAGDGQARGRRCIRCSLQGGIPCTRRRTGYRSRSCPHGRPPAPSPPFISDSPSERFSANPPLRMSGSQGAAHCLFIGMAASADRMRGTRVETPLYRLPLPQTSGPCFPHTQPYGTSVSCSLAA